MKKNNILKFSIILVIIVFLIILFILLRLNKDTTETGNNINEEEPYKEEEMAELEIDESIDEVNELNSFCMAEDVINQHQDNGNKFYASKIYFQETDVVVSYRLYIFGEIFNTTNRTSQNAFYAIDFDTTTGTYKYSQQKLDIDQTEFEQIATTGEQKYVITEEITGEFFQNDIADNTTVKRYFEYYKMLILTNPEKAYSLIDEKYKNLRFENNYENFNNYIQQNLAEFENMEFSKFTVNYFNSNKQYVAYSNYEDFYIFTVNNNIMDFTVLLDEYIVDLPQFVTKYEESDSRVKTGLNISKFINGLNDKNYYYVSTLIADSFKTANNLTNITDLENYLKTNFYDQNEVEYSIFTEQGSYCIYDVTLKNKNGTETKSMKFVMELGDGTDFKMSFSF